MDEGMYYPVQGNEGMKLYIARQRAQIKMPDEKRKEYREISEHLKQFQREFSIHKN